MNRKNPTSPIRSGFDYQDLWGLFFCADWLRNPSKYKWIRFETTPEDLEKKKFYLDDIVICDSKNLYLLFQFKHKQDRNESWTWTNFLKREKDKKGNLKDSLLQKWFKSYYEKKINHKIRKACFITNGTADQSLSQYLNNKNYFEYSKIRKNKNLYDSICEQISDDRIKDFFENFEFKFGQEELNDLEKVIRDQFYQELRATKYGVDNLLLEIKKECRQQFTNEISLEQIRKWCEWDIPKPLNENFQIPKDFVLFDKKIHRQTLSDLKNPSGGIKVFWGKPGCGKSTYLSKLYKLLISKKIISIRHHYHISPNENNPLERLNSARVIEAIKAQIKNFSAELGYLASQNSAKISIREYLNQLSKKQTRNKKALVLIIDGLDHVLRHKNETELKEFLAEVCYPQSGLWIVLGMQLQVKNHLPSIIFDYCSEDNWTEIKGFDLETTGNVVRKNISQLNLPTDGRLFKKIIDELYIKTQGNPLHLRYTLQFLKNKIDHKRILGLYDCKRLISYNGEIRAYYNSLWLQIPELGKTIVLTIKSAGFLLKRSQIFELINLIEQNPAEISKSFKSIAHLLIDSSSRVSIFHNSFDIFLSSTIEFEIQKSKIIQNLKNWLEHSTYDALKWSELRRLNMESGNYKPILEIDRDWVIDAICYPRDSSKIIEQLELAAMAAFKSKLYPKCLELGYLKNIFENATDLDCIKNIYDQAFKLNKLNWAELNLDNLHSQQLNQIGELAEQDSKTEILKNVFHLLRERQEKDYQKKDSIHTKIPEIPGYLINIIALNRNHEPKRVIKYIKSFRDLGWSDALFSIYSKTLLKTGQDYKLDQLMRSGLNKTEIQLIISNCAEFDLNKSQKKFMGIISLQRSQNINHFSRLYLLLRGIKKMGTPDLPTNEDFPIEAEYYDTQKKEAISLLFYDCFLLGMIYGLRNKESNLLAWIENAVEKNWAIETAAKIMEVSLKLSVALRTGSKINISESINGLNSIKELFWQEDGKIYELRSSLENAICSFLKLLILIKLASNDRISKNEFDSILNCKFLNNYKILEFLKYAHSPVLEKEAYVNYIKQEENRIRKDIIGFPDRADYYLDLSKLAEIYDDLDNAKKFLRLAADNLLGYGYHKDMYLDQVLASIKTCHLNGSKSACDWLLRIAPLIENVSEYTDGDETIHLPTEFGKILLGINKSLLFSYYFGSAENEKLYLAEDLFECIIKSLEFKNDEEIALATTVIDGEALEALREMALNNKGAQRALKNNLEYFGSRPLFTKEDKEKSFKNEDEKEVDYLKIGPNEIANHLKTLESRWDQEKFLSAWMKTWVSQKRIDKRNFSFLIIDLIDNLIGPSQMGGDLLNCLYSFIYEFDKEKAFDYLCWAQANDGGWQSYWSDKSRAEWRWVELKKNHPTKYIKFFELSLFRTGIGYGRGANYFIPIPRGVEFLNFFDDIKLAEEITEYSVRFAESLMANLELPECKWIQIPQIDVIDILIQRLKWPGPFVRERAAMAIAELIGNSNRKNEIYKRLLNWINSQELESLVAIGLLPIIKAIETHGKKIKFIKLKEIVNAVPHSSVVIDNLIAEITRLLDSQAEFTLPPYKNIDPYPANYEVGRFFKRSIRSLLAPIYSIKSEIIEKKTGFEFGKQWAYTAQQLMLECKIKEEIGEAGNYLGGNRSEMLYGMSTKMSEIYRSAFLRSLQMYYGYGLIPEEFYLEYAFLSMPIELSFWKIKPSHYPAWWPNLKKEEDLAGQLDSCVDRILKENEQKESALIGLEGTIKIDNTFSNEISCSATLIAFAYKIIGKNLPTADDIAAKILYAPTLLLYPLAARPFNFLEAEQDLLPTVSEPIKIYDLIIYPLVFRIKDLVINSWQWFRQVHTPFIFSNQICNWKIKIGQDNFEFIIKNSSIGQTSDWIEGLQQRYYRESDAPHGQYMLIDSKYLSSFLNKNALRIGYILKKRFLKKNYSYEDPQISEENRLIGMSKIII